jgi:hypothetical protein
MPGIDLRTTTSLHPHAGSTVQSIQNTTSTLAPAPTLHTPSIQIHRIVWQSYTHEYTLQNPNRARRSAPLQVGSVNGWSDAAFLSQKTVVSLSFAQVGSVNGWNAAFSRQAPARFGIILPLRTNGFNAAHAAGELHLNRATIRKLQGSCAETVLHASASLSPHESTKSPSSRCWASGRKRQKSAV